ncbi:condensation domain-containing protein [Nonomuraea sp. 3N208]|uniref:condensation domain-containing protein n=1 Tax=Nonomuraea sp. 3N208 TaxID=3457421 RepID=UPI003FD06E2D
MSPETRVVADHQEQGTSEREELRRRLAALPPERRAALRRSLLGGPEKRTWPLSTGQERLWFLQRFDPDDCAYHITWPVRLRGPIDETALAAAFTAIAARHEVLRTRFVLDGDLPAQVVDEPCEVRLDRLDPVQVVDQPCEVWPDRLDPVQVVDEPRLDSASSDVEQAIAAYAGRPFDLAAAPAWRAGLLRLAADDAVLCIVLHHIVVDHWSLDVLMRELGECYRAHREGRPPLLEDLPTQYRDFAVTERRRAEEDRDHLDYWVERLAGAPPLDLPLDHPRPARWTGRGAKVGVAVPDAAVARLELLARAHRATLFMALLAAWQVTLGAAAGQDDFCVGVPVAGRDRPELAPLIGYFSTTLVARADLSGDPSFGDLLRRTRISTLKALAHAGTSLDRILGALRVPRDLSRPPLCQAMFNLTHNLPTGDLLRTELGDLAVEVYPQLDLGRARVEVSLDVYRGPEGVGGWLEFATDLFDAATAHRLADTFARVVTRAGGDPDLRLSELGAADRKFRS